MYPAHASFTIRRISLSGSSCDSFPVRSLSSDVMVILFDAVCRKLDGRLCFLRPSSSSDTIR